MNWWAIFQLFVLFAVICWPIAAWFILTGRGARAQALASQKWPTAPGTVLQSEVVRTVRLFSNEANDYIYTPTVRYAYEVAGKRYEGDTIRFGLIVGKQPFQEDGVIKPYPVGGAVNVHYDPADPKTSVLETTVTEARGRVWGGWIMTAVPFLLIALLWWVSRR
jgi:hypothetical protein